MTKVLYFEGAGMDFYSKEQTKHSDIGNFRIRTSFLNNFGQQIYLEIMNGYVYDKKGKNIERFSMHIDFCFEVPEDKEEEIQYHKIYNRNKDHLQTREYDYTKHDITKWINDNLNCSFDTIQVLDRFYGYRVHGNHREYNLMENIELNHSRAKARKEAYNNIVERYKKLFNRKYPAISIKEMTNDYIVFDNHQGDELLKKYNLTSRYDKVLI